MHNTFAQCALHCAQCLAAHSYHSAGCGCLLWLALTIALRSEVCRAPLAALPSADSELQADVPAVLYSSWFATQDPVKGYLDYPTLDATATAN
jgi:hypothetical protein